ncbi:MAG: 3,4-dihydroxy-2-butanone-4-phosphate synthase [Betaproteobacteria bacterium RIFCSPLOWO2_02_67_12]|nr:MAG: 3,4-dihydroxy-2-butanone-4-phosphate synthase [Betaproteobacteria bacterium RIFCSPLOWO2_02_67_12]OGA27161.1 MAG: 3,4-dihydroxy-2-butanone-4-phosphate synthase [Betaproteobacteria bacterium RIFCSPLOWO2_02_FULL_68_150]OGA63658.1 MAG: 3,4-dihydroxy-2-butanone-4-phosphate synthase [Betaproteobacteria bacterium RIFCSPLOWO2_12_FULL_67_28]
MRTDPSAISPIAQIIEEVRAGRIVVLVDDEDRENEGDLVFAADFVTPEKVNFLATHGRGLICMPVTEEHAARLGLRPMVSQNRSRHGTNFTVSIEAAEGIATGISAHDRALTIKVAAARDAKPVDIVQPGHVFPLIAQPGGVLVRAGHTEACCDLARLAGLAPAAVLCEIMKDDGSMARLPDLLQFAAQHGLKIGTIADLIHYRNATESLVRRVAERELATAAGAFRMIAYRDLPAGGMHLALVRGELAAARETLVRVHEPLSILDLLDAGPGTHSWSIPESLAAIDAQGCGAIVLLNCAQTDEALEAHLLDPAREAQKHAGRSYDLRTYGIGAQILRDLGVGRMRLMAAPRKMPSMAGFGLEVSGYLERATR